MRKLFAIVPALLLSSFASFEGEGTEAVQVGLTNLTEHPRDFDGKHVVTDGYVSVDGDDYYLYRSRSSASRGDYSDGVDLVSLSRNLLTKQVGGCARVSGKFAAFDENSIGIGSFRSPNGFIEVDGVSLKDCRR